MLGILVVPASFGNKFPLITQITIEKINKKELLILINNQCVKGCHCGNIYYPPTHPVKWNYKLELAALKHSKYMKKNNHFSHYDLNVQAWGTRISKEGYDWSLCAENIAKDIKISKIVVEFWLKNTNDCINLMSPRYVDIGVGRYGQYWTILFARKFKLSNCPGC